MDVIKIYDAVEKLRTYIYLFNEHYMRQRAEMTMNGSLLSSYVKRLCDMGMSDAAYWDNVGIDFRTMYGQVEELERAETQKDFVYIYDKTNYEIWEIVKNICEVLFGQYADTLKSYIWENNQEALKIRFPEVWKQLKAIPEKESCQCVRSYGLRGKVVYRKNAGEEFDLYSGYNLAGLKIIRAIDYERYNKICVWGCNGGFESREMALLLEFANLDIEIYVTDLNEFKQVLLNTRRKGVLLDDLIHWKFNFREEDFINSFDMDKRDKTYIYVCKCGGNSAMLKEFIHKNSLNSNVGEL